MEVLAGTHGLAHPVALVTRNNLARVHALLGDFTSAFTEVRAVLEIRVEALGDGHPDTEDSRNTLAQIEEWQRELEQ